MDLNLNVTLKPQKTVITSKNDKLRFSVSMDFCLQKPVEGDNQNLTVNDLVKLIEQIYNKEKDESVLFLRFGSIFKVLLHS